MSMFVPDETKHYILSFCNSVVGLYLIKILSPSTDTQVGQVRTLPVIISKDDVIDGLSQLCVEISKQDWDAHETSWDIETSPLLAVDSQTYCDNIDWMIECHRRKTGEQICIDPAAPEFGSLQWRYAQYCQKWECLFDRLHHNEEELNRKFIDIYG